MKTTTNYGMKKPEGTEVVDIDDINYNSDIIDSELKKAANHIVDSTKHITSAERTAWNAKQPAGNYLLPSALDSYAKKDLSNIDNGILKSKVEAAGVSGKKYAKIVVGTMSSGHTLNNVDFLCTGSDDQTKIREAINSVNTSIGGKIVFLEGTYQLVGQNILAVGSNTTLEGLNAVFNIAASGAATVINISSYASNVYIKNIQFKMSSTMESTIIQLGDHASNVIVENCKFQNMSTSINNAGIRTNQFSGFEVINNQFEGLYFAAYVNTASQGVCSQFNFAENSIQNTSEAVKLNKLVNSKITNNYIMNIRISAVECSYCESTMISGNQIWNTQGGLDAYGVKCTNANYIQIIGNTIQALFSGIKLTGCEEVAIDSNFCKDMSNSGIYIDVSRYTTTTNNICYDNGCNIYTNGSPGTPMGANSSFYHIISNNLCIIPTGSSKRIENIRVQGRFHIVTSNIVRSKAITSLASESIIENNSSSS